MRPALRRIFRDQRSECSWDYTIKIGMSRVRIPPSPLLWARSSVVEHHVPAILVAAIAVQAEIARHLPCKQDQAGASPADGSEANACEDYIPLLTGAQKARGLRNTCRLTCPCSSTAEQRTRNAQVAVRFRAGARLLPSSNGLDPWPSTRGCEFDPRWECARQAGLVKAPR